MNAIQRSTITRAERERWLHLVADDQHKERCAQRNREKQPDATRWHRAAIIAAFAASLIVGLILGLAIS